MSQNEIELFLSISVAARPALLRTVSVTDQQLQRIGLTASAADEYFPALIAAAR